MKNNQVHNNQVHQEQEVVNKLIERLTEYEHSAKEIGLKLKELAVVLNDIQERLQAGAATQDVQEELTNLLIQFNQITSVKFKPNITKDELDKLNAATGMNFTLEDVELQNKFPELSVKKEYLHVLKSIAVEWAERLKERTTPPRLLPRYPLCLSIDNTPVVNKLESLIQDIAKIENSDGLERKAVNVGNVNVYVTAAINSAKVSFDRPFSEYDRGVSDSVDSLIEAGNNRLTPDMIYRMMNGNREDDKASDAAKKEILKSLKKQRLTIAEIDRSDVIKRWKLEGEKAVISGTLLDFIECKVTTGGKTVSAFYFTRPSLLHLDAKASGQIISIPNYLLDVKKLTLKGKVSTISIYMTSRRIAVRNYLIRRIAVMKRNVNGTQSSLIRLDSIYAAATTGKELNKKECRLVRDFVDTALKFFKAVKYIKDFAYKKEGRAIAAVQIIL